MILVFQLNTRDLLVEEEYQLQRDFWDCSDSPHARLKSGEAKSDSRRVTTGNQAMPSELAQ